MVSRHDQRRRALDLLYQADLRDRDPNDVLREADGDAALEPFTSELVTGYRDHRERLDGLISQLARDWTLDRMPVVDRNILRIGLYELVCTEVPSAVAINEAVELAKELSTDDSGRYINGILSRAAERRRTEVEPGDGPPGEAPPGEGPRGDGPPGETGKR